jgi:hypothetical protein
LKAGVGAFADQVPLELGQGREDVEDQAAAGGGGVDSPGLPSVNFEPQASKISGISAATPESVEALREGAWL